MSLPPELSAPVEALGLATPAERPAAVGRLLAALGLAVRCGDAFCAEAAAALGPADAESWLAAFDLSVLRGELARAADAAVEAALADTPAERASHEKMALAALRLRDELESALVAAALCQPPAAGLPAVRDAVAQLDAQAPALARRLVGLNPQRRAARDRLAPEHQARAWWYAARADCDSLVRLWQEAELAADETAHCAACAKDRSAAPLADRPPDDCLSSAEIWQLSHDGLHPAHRQQLERHAQRCGECALALQALDVPLPD